MRKWWLWFGGGAVGAGMAVQAFMSTPADIWGLIYDSSLPTLSTGQSTVWHGSSTGQLKVDGIPAGSCSNSLDFTDSCNSQYIGLL